MNNESSVRILIDAGQTGSRVRIVTATGVHEYEDEPVHTDRPVVEQIRAVVERRLEADGELGANTEREQDRESGGTDQVTAVHLAAGVSGLTPAARSARSLLDGLADLGVTRVALAHDSVSAYLAANGFAKGAVTAAGTGVVSLGVGVEIARVDGWGFMYGDAGSGYWIGRAGIDAALRSYDGRGRPTRLEAATEAEFGPLPEVYMTMQGDPDRVSRTAGFAREVDNARADGDAVAAEIIAAAAEELALSAHTALQRSGWRPGDPGRVSWMGAVLTKNETIRERFGQIVARTAPGIEIGSPHGTPLDGVARFLDLPADHPLTAEVDNAKR